MANTVYYNANPTSEAALIVFDCNRVINIFPVKVFSTIGRTVNQSQCDIRINSPIVSRMHGEIRMLNDNYYYRDLGSTNGTYINGNHIGKTPDSKSEGTVLNEGDIISFDIVQGNVHHPDRICALFTKILCKKYDWETLKLQEDYAEISIGRSVDTGVKIDNNLISEKHASFFHSKNGWAIIDHNSTNGVYLNGKRITSPRYLEDISSVRIADTYVIFTGEYLLFSSGVFRKEAPARPLFNTEKTNETQNMPRVSTDIIPSKHPDLIISIEERSVVQRFKKMLLLQDINISVSNGEMVLILGGSGAGKTTFINAVMGYEKASGKIIYNDTDIYEEYEQMKYEIGFVPQQDLLRGSDTVYDTLSNAAEMKLPKNISFEKREERINEVLNEFGLSREKDSLISKLSGGQRKRLSIAIEFIANPSLFFLDEPDSGIDDVMGRGLMENLRHIADLGKIVMVITHSPERASDLFNKVIVLAKSSKDNCGHLAFFGSVKEAFSFFEVSSFREIVKKINRKDENGDGLSDYYIEKYNGIEVGQH